jgi:hypothetical protein
MKELVFRKMTAADRAVYENITGNPIQGLLT